MKGKKIAFIAAAVILLPVICGTIIKAPPLQNETERDTQEDSTASATESTEEDTTEMATEHISPVETVSATLGSQYTVEKTMQRTEGSNTIKIPLPELIEDGDRVASFTFIIYSEGGGNIGEFKGGCGVSVDMECASATDKGWYQSGDFTAPTQGTYGEITWNVPEDVSEHIHAGGELLFGYWWGDTESIRVENVVCTFTRTRALPIDGGFAAKVGESVSFSAADSSIHIPLDFLPEGAVPQTASFNISSSGKLGKYTGAYGYSSSEGEYQSGNTAVFTDSSELELTWFVPDEAKSYAADDGELILHYWWSEQPSVTLDSVYIRYSLGGAPAGTKTEKPSKPADSGDDNISASGFRSAKDIADEIKVGWNLGNTLDSYNTGMTGLNTETGWGNPKTTREMIRSVKSAGFNSIRIPVTWSEHMDGDTIQKEWLDRVQEIVDYAYDEDMFVILNMHHDDYIWFEPLESEYSGDSSKLKKIWEQISARFKDYGDRLLFEGMNEPRTVGSAKEWQGGTPDERAVLNKYVRDFTDTVRASGGNNADRTLIVTSYAASADTLALGDAVIPGSGNIIFSVHYYAPWNFSEGRETSFTDSGKSEIDAKFAELKKKFIDKGIPVIIDEFGCVNAADESVRSEYLRYYINSAGKNGIKCFIWDNGVSSGESSFGIFDRKSLTWNSALLSAVMDGASGR